MKTGWIGLGAILVYTYVKNNNEPSNLGVHEGRLGKLPYAQKGVSTQTNNFQKQIEPMKFKGTLEKSKERIKKIINRYPNSKIIKEDKNYIHAVFESSKMKFKDDVEFYFNEEKRMIECRSVARVGYYDFKVNRKRYEEIRKEYR
ncbi:MAG: DUF1499 domain-containing protein [Anaeromicrobium sp.]|jgi:uncharacterized protein (DUF1499 family)|uniref:DUF1499 domain-containing protein n=1 Tax=Anaeromicrobium sp. TaxID=1929132 RepID=UPI0025FB42A0|nr:DUF1499 domain-containing protein [Anaeromicrobium sp.]MCT4593276.1 DUF1499 domain-containing protein [Anaeromicrobium sp.]